MSTLPQQLTDEFQRSFPEHIDLAIKRVLNRNHIRHDECEVVSGDGFQRLMYRGKVLIEWEPPRTGKLVNGGSTLITWRIAASTDSAALAAWPAGMN